jgi:GTP pyrophosphokinase
MPLESARSKPDETLRGRIEREISEAGAFVDLPLVLRAFDFSETAHSGQRRKSGESFMLHPAEVASIMLELLGPRADSVLLASALLHDVCEDTDVTIKRIESEFGAEVAAIVDGVTKISGLEFESPEAEQAENFRKMLLSMARDIRVILVKLGDRLHNMRTLEPLRPDQRERIARETRDVYAPLAHRLGIGKLKWELEDLSLKWLDPQAYHTLAEQVSVTRAERERFIDEMKQPVLERLREAGIRADVTGRAKHFFSIYRKMQVRGVRLEEMYDLFGVRVVTRTKAECYQALGIIHDLFVPVQDRFKDYIALPKTNLYQSLHTTVIGPNRRMVEIQIRTREMHMTAELGIAAHYSYKEGGPPDRELQEKFGGLFASAAEWESEAGDAQDFMDFLHLSLYQDEVFIFTPKRELKRLPKGSTPIDFAYMIHSQVGGHCVGARVNGRIVPLRYELRNGDIVEIITSSNAQPTKDWLGLVATSKARAKIRHHLNAREQQDSIALGRDMLQREFRRHRQKVPADKDLTDAAQALGFDETELLLAAVGRGDISAVHVFNKVHPPEVPKKPTSSSTVERLKNLAFRDGGGLRIQDIDNLMIRIAQCCSPVPGERVVGIVTRGRGVSVHRIDCPNTFDSTIQPERRMAVQWDVDADRTFLVKLVVYGRERGGLLADIAEAITGSGTNIRRAEVDSDSTSARGNFVVAVKNLGHLRRVIGAIRKVRGVTRIERHHQISEPRKQGGEEWDS